MNDFLEKLYSNENFGVYLVIVIAILVVLFFVVLFFGKKDEAKSKKSLEEANELPPSDDVTPINNVSNNIETPISLEASMVANEPTNDLQNSMLNEPVTINPETPIESSTPINDVPVSNIETTPVVPPVNPAPTINVSEPINVSPAPVIPEVDQPLFKEVSNDIPLEVPVVEESNNVDLKKEFDFDALADAISKELESMNDKSKPEVSNVDVTKPVIEEKPFAFPDFEPVEPDVLPKEVITEVPSSEIVKPKPAMPTVFSSVYVNRNEPKSEPVKPAFELPKMADLPKKSENVSEDTLKIPSLLDQLKEESYQIKK